MIRSNDYIQGQSGIPDCPILYYSGKALFLILVGFLNQSNSKQKQKSRKSKKKHQISEINLLCYFRWKPPYFLIFPGFFSK